MATKATCYLFGILFILVSFSGCDSGSSDNKVNVLSDGASGIDENDTSDEIISKITGSYQIKESTVTFENGSKVFLSAKEGELEGQMDISESGVITQSLTVVSLGKTIRGKITIEEATKDYFKITSKQCTYNLLYKYAVTSVETSLATTATEKVVCGRNDFEEVDVWIKDSVQKNIKASTTSPKQTIQRIDAGGIIGKITKPY